MIMHLTMRVHLGNAATQINSFLLPVSFPVIIVHTTHGLNIFDTTPSMSDFHWELCTKTNHEPCTGMRRKSVSVMSVCVLGESWLGCDFFVNRRIEISNLEQRHYRELLLFVYSGPLFMTSLVWTRNRWTALLGVCISIRFGMQKKPNRMLCLGMKNTANRTAE